MTVSVGEYLGFETSREVPWEISSQSSQVSLTKTGLSYHWTTNKYYNGSPYSTF